MNFRGSLPTFSPKVARLHATDPSIDHCVIETQGHHNQFEEFLMLGSGGFVVVNGGNRPFLTAVASELNNYELYCELHSHFAEGASVSAFCAQFGTLGSFDSPSEGMVEYLASHFYEMPPAFLNGFSATAIARILSTNGLQILTEDSLLEFILGRIDSNRDFRQLLDCVRFEFLMLHGIGRFISWSMDHFDELDVTLFLWQRVTARLALNVNPGRLSGRDRLYRRGFPLKSGSPLDGIIAFLTKEHDGNVHDRGIVQITASGTDYGFHPQRAADLQSQNFFQVSTPPVQWLMYDFKNRRVCLTHSTHVHYPGYLVRSWVLEGSVDGRDGSWIAIDTQTNSTAADADRITTFPVTQSELYRFVRLRQTGKDSRGSTCLIVHALELFGALIE